LFLNQENEFQHWLSLVALPLLLLYGYRRSRGSRLAEVFASVGLSRSVWKNGLAWAIPLGLALSFLQLVVSNRSDAMWALVASGKAFYLFPLALAFLLLTAGFTEEFFFRGVMQTRLSGLLRGKVRGVLVASVLFGLYHLPYAYLNPQWPSHGDWSAAFVSAMGQGVAGGLVLGFVFERSGRNLLASVSVHALINVFPAMTMIKFG
jgi:membrane protease YdiL (CAAX protease family)